MYIAGQVRDFKQNIYIIIFIVICETASANNRIKFY